MRRNQLQVALDRVKSRTPWLLWKGCDNCGEEFRRESMFYFKYWAGSPMSNHSYKNWFCKRCCPTRDDVLLRNPDHFKDVDLSSLTPIKGG